MYDISRSLTNSISQEGENMAESIINECFTKHSSKAGGWRFINAYKDRLKTAEIKNGQVKVDGNHCEHCGKYTLFLVDKNGHKLCPNCSNDPSVIAIFNQRDELARLEKKVGRKCEHCGEIKKDVRFRRKNKIYLKLCNDCLKILSEIDL